MSGYLVLPRQALDLFGGPMPTAPEQIAFIDFLREIEQTSFPFTRLRPVCVTGLDELLVTLGCTDRRAGAKELALMQGCKSRLRHAAVEIKRLTDIHVPVAYDLVLGGESRLSARHTPQDLVPLWRIFGLNPTNRGEIARGHIAYHFGETL